MSVKKPSGGRKRMTVMQRNETIAGYLFVLPLLLGIVFLTYGQFIYSLVISFTDWSVFGSQHYLGFANYTKLLTEDFFFWKSIKATVLYAFGSVICTQLAALARNMDGKAEARMVYALVNTLCELPGVRRAALFIQGSQPDSLAGAIYLPGDFLPNTDLIAE